MTQFFINLRSIFFPLVLLGLVQTTQASPNDFNVGAGIYDITGPAAEIDMMGYAQIGQRTSGIHTRLWSRAFIIEDPNSRKRIVFVSADLGMIFHSIKYGVIKSLKQLYGDTYNHDNVMLSATHTHSGSGGYAFRTLYNVTSLGFDKDNYQTIVSGIVSSITRAHNNLEPGYITIASSQLNNTAKNRSMAAFLRNPQQDRLNLKHTTDKSFTQINLFNQQHKPIGLINWHAVHGVSMSNKNTLISSDNKGYAAYLFEKKMHANYLLNKTFVAAFAQSNEGDASPNIFTEPNTGQCLDFNCPDIRHTKVIANRQFDKADELFSTKQTHLLPAIDYRFKTIDMENQLIKDPNIPETEYHTATAALGYAFGAGTSDGLGLTSLFNQGQLNSNPFVNIVRNTIAKPTPDLIKAQKPKPILLAVGLNNPSWVSHNLPIQLFKIGQLLIAGVPAEFTTMAGIRLKSQLHQIFGDQIQHVVIAGLANDYSGYVTTFEEYQQQNYEGGFTLFGPWTLHAYLQNFSSLANDLIEDKPTEAGAEPEDLHKHPISMIPPVLFDDTPPGADFGSVHIQPNLQYQAGQIVHTAFWAGHPRNHFQTMGSFLEVQFYNTNHWQTLYYDKDPCTIYQWQRVGISYALGHIYWQIPNDAPKGRYRIKHHGHYKYGWTQSIFAYDGISKEFTLY